jgi:hypothetical protein
MSLHQKLHDPALPHSERLDRIGKYLDDLQLHRDSRKGLDGARGPEGPASTVPGPAGKDGKDADPSVVAELVKKSLKRDFEEFVDKVEGELVLAKAAIRALIIDELKISNVIDAKGNAILIPGPAGAPGKDSTIPGPAGKDGKSIVGPAGRDGRDANDPKVAVGNVVSGDKASVTVHEQDGVFVFDFVLPKGDVGATGAASTVPGPKGDLDTSNNAFRNAVAEIIVDMKKRGSLGSLGHVGSNESGTITKADLKELLAELKAQQLEQPEKKKGWFRS